MSKKFDPRKLKKMRAKAKISLEVLAGKLVAAGVQVSYGTVRNWEEGNTTPNFDQVCALAELFKSDADDLCSASTGAARAAIVAVALLTSGTALAAVAGQSDGMDKAELTAHMTPYFNEVVDAIYKAEGGAAAKKPFGVLSVPCSDYTDCRKVCFNTVRNNYFRWITAGRPGEYLSFLGSKYCPVGAANDPRGLNRNWIGNVSKLMEGGR